MLIIASCMFLCIRGLYCGTECFAVIFGLSPVMDVNKINWNWTQIKLNSSLSGTNDSGANTSMFPVGLFGVKTNPAKSAQSFEVIFDKHFTFCSHISAVCSSCFHHTRDLRSIHRYLDLGRIISNSVRVWSSRLLQSLQFTFVRYHRHWTHQTSTYSESTGLFGDKVSSIYLQCFTASFLSLLTSKI